MTNLLIILVVLFAVLALVVKLTEKHAKPIDSKEQNKLSRIAMVLIAMLIIGRLIQEIIKS
jgi:preprotein translocase subunit SecG